jgi:hypothetical protein
MEWILGIILVGLLLFTNIDDRLSAALGGEGSFGWWIAMLLTVALAYALLGMTSAAILPSSSEST